MTSNSQNKNSILPSVYSKGESSGSGPSQKQHPLWIRLGAFLSMRSPNTRRSYMSIFKEWCEFLGAEVASDKAAELVLKANDLQAQAYRAWLERRPGERPRMLQSKSTSRALLKKTKIGTVKKDGLQYSLSNATIWKKFAALRRMYRMIIASDLGTSSNPFDIDTTPPPPKDSGKKRPTEMIPFEDVRKILEGPDTREQKGLRDLAILAALFGGGLRRSEIINLRLGDLAVSHAGNAFLRLRATKSRKDFNQALPQWAADIIFRWKKIREHEGATSGDYLFTSFRGRGGLVSTPNPISSDGIYRLFKQYCIRAGVKVFATPHSARATAITKLLADGVPHRMVQEFSRHSSIQM
ncbi:MAG: site-specific integrase, partial [SAR324 cluster bacterium]|nr:site-specific integrase [SAR324 cluster bacterium]